MGLRRWCVSEWNGEFFCCSGSLTIYGSLVVVDVMRFLPPIPFVSHSYSAAIQIVYPKATHPVDHDIFQSAFACKSRDTLKQGPAAFCVMNVGLR